MIKNCLFAAALASLALAGGCAKGGNGVVPPPPSVTVTADTNASAIYPTQILTLTAATTSPAYAPVTWSLSGPGAITSTTPPDAATKTSATATYQAPTTVPAAGSQPTVTATLVSDTSIAGPLALTVVDITTDIAPATLSVGKGLTQTFTAVAVPDAAETQSFYWSCAANGVACANFSPAPNVASLGLAVYTAQDNCSGSCVQISAITPLDANGCAISKNCTIAKVSLVTSRVSGTYAFQFSGYDSNNQATAVAGTFTASSGTNGTATITGVEDELISSGRVQRAITGGYAPISSTDPNSNNAGTITLALPGIYPNIYQVVLDGTGDIEMIESDLHGIGSGVAEKTSTFNSATAQTFAFGFTGVDLVGNRVGYAGLIPMDGNGNVVGGLMDVNDNGNSINSICGAPPCAVTGTYQQNNGIWQLTLTSPINMVFDFFVASGAASKTNPLTLYAITDPTDTTNPAVSGTMVLQDSSLIPFSNSTFKGTSVSALTGTNTTCAAPPCTNVSLTLGTTDSSGNFSGQFDQNNAGTITSVPSTSPFAYKYCNAATPACGTPSYTNGRYTFQMLGNPTASPVVAPLTFVLYAIGANRGFLLEQGGASPLDTSVITGTVNPQGKAAFGFPGSALPGTYAAATTSSGSSGVDAIAANLLLTWVNTGACTSECVNGTQYDSATPAGAPLALAYTLQDTGNGTIVPISPATTPNYVIYVQDTSGCTTQSPVCAIQDFLMIDEDKTVTNPSIIFAQQ